VNPRHTGPLTPLGNHIPALFDQPTLCGHPWRCESTVREGRCHFHDTVPPTLVPPPRCPLEIGRWRPRKGNDHLHRRKGSGATAGDDAVTQVRRGRSSQSPPALCGHPRHCVAILGTAVSSPALWEPRSTGG
jgi:hypothetical protein